MDEGEAGLLEKLESLANTKRAASLWIATLKDSPTHGSFVDNSHAARYDANNNSTVEHNEALNAVADFNADELTEDQLMMVVAHYGFSKGIIPIPQLMELVMATSWYQDGIDEDIYHAEPNALRALHEIDNNNPKLAETLLGWPWIFDEILVDDETAVLVYLRRIDEKAPEVAQLVAHLPWLADNIVRWEPSAVDTFSYLVQWNQTDFAAELAKEPWVTDGVTFLEVLFGMRSLSAIAVNPDLDLENPQIASSVMGFIRYPPDVVDLSLISVMDDLREQIVFNAQTRMEEHTPDRLNPLLTEPWVANGLNQKERVYLIATASAHAYTDPDRIYDPYTIETKTIELPLAGPVHLWVVGHHQFNSRNTLARLERAVRGAEQFWGIPFPITHAILYAREPGTRGLHIGYMMFLDTYDGDVPQGNMFHETAHYYCTAGHSWFAEGCAEVIKAYISRNGNLPDPIFPDYCAEEGLRSIQDLHDMGGHTLWDSCSYSMGMHFLLTLRNIMGGEGWLSALRAFYLKYGIDEGLYLSSVDDATDEEVYRVFLEHTPPNLVEDVKDVFRQLHGGSFIDQ